jgi:hypothetical protein
MSVRQNYCFNLIKSWISVTAETARIKPIDVDRIESEREGIYGEIIKFASLLLHG